MLGRLMDVRQGEGRTLASTSAILALVTAAHTMLETARDTLFLSKLPPSRLAWVYVLLAVLSLIAGALSSKIARRFGRRAGFVVTLGICAYLIVVLSLRTPTPTTVFVLYVTSGVIGTILTLQFWLFAGQLFTVAQGKRLFGPMASGGVLGATLGATFAAVLLRFSPPSTLIFIGAVFFLVAGLVVTFVPATEGIDDVDPSPVRAFSWLHDVSLLRSDRYLALVGGLTVVATATVLLADYLFKSSAAKTLGPDKLGPFLGVFYAVQNAIALVVQLFVTGALVRRLGLTTTLLLFPLLMALGGLGVITTGAFAAALAVKATDGSLRHSLHRVTTELLMLPLPGDVRDRAKRLFDTMLGRGTQAVAATLIVVLSAMDLADSHTLGILVGGLALAWLGTAFAMRAPYLDVFRRALARGELAGGEHDLDLSAMETILESLASSDEAQVIAGIDVLASAKRRRLLPALILYHESPAVLEHALGVFAAEPRRDVVPLAERLLGHPEPSVRAAAVRALAAAGRKSAAELALQDADPKVRAYAAFFLAIEAEAPLEHPLIVALLEEPGDDATQRRSAVLDVIAEHGDERWGSVVAEIVARDAGRRGFGASAARAIKRTRHVALADFLVEKLVVREGRQAVRDALVILADRGFSAVERAISDPATPERVRWQLPRAIAAFGTQAAVDVLVTCLEVEQNPAVRYRVVKALGRLSTDAKKGVIGKLKFDRAVLERHTQSCLVEFIDYFEMLTALEAKKRVRPSRPPPAADGSAESLYPLPDFDQPVADVLVGLVRDRADNALERAFRFLQLAHRNEDIESVHHAVVRGDKRARATALEFLDLLTIGERGVRPLLRVVVDDLEPRERARRAKATAYPQAESVLDHDGVVKKLIRDADTLLAALAASYAFEAGLSELVTLAREEVARRPELLRLRGVEVAAPMELSHA